MTQYEKLNEIKNKMRIAMERTTGYTRSIWESKYFYFQNLIDNLTIEEAEKFV